MGKKKEYIIGLDLRNIYIEAIKDCMKKIEKLQMSLNREQERHYDKIDSILVDSQNAYNHLDDLVD